MKIYQDKFTHKSLLNFSAVVDGYVVLINKKTKAATEEIKKHKILPEYAKVQFNIKTGEDAYDFDVILTDEILSDFKEEIDEGRWYWAEGETLGDKLLFTMSHLNTTFIINNKKVLFIKNNRNVILLELPNEQGEFIECLDYIKQEQQIDWNNAKLYYDAKLGNFYISDSKETELEEEGNFVALPYYDKITINDIKGFVKKNNTKPRVNVVTKKDYQFVVGSLVSLGCLLTSIFLIKADYTISGCFLFLLGCIGYFITYKVTSKKLKNKRRSKEGLQIQLTSKSQECFNTNEFSIKGINYRNLDDSILGDFVGYVRALKSNPHDKYAIGVYVSGRHVGFLPRGNKELHDAIMTKGGTATADGYIAKHCDESGHSFYYGKVTVHNV